MSLYRRRGLPRFFVVVVVCLPRPMEGMGRLQFLDLFTELPVPPQPVESSEHFNVFFMYNIILSTTVSFLRMPYYFYKVSLFCTFPFFFASTLAFVLCI